MVVSPKVMCMSRKNLKSKQTVLGNLIRPLCADRSMWDAIKLGCFQQRGKIKTSAPFVSSDNTWRLPPGLHVSVRVHLRVCVALCIRCAFRLLVNVFDSMHSLLERQCVQRRGGGRGEGGGRKIRQEVQFNC